MPVPGPVQRVAVPAEHLLEQPKAALPASPPTYTEILRLWFTDRAAIDKLNGQIGAIKSLNQGD